MEDDDMKCQYEVLHPWAEADPIPLRGISPRLADLSGKTIGLFAANAKVASRPILTVVERRLRDRFPSSEFSWFVFDHNLNVVETKEKARFEEWVKGIDAAVTAVGD
jgi:hypothetical protein